MKVISECLVSSYGHSYQTEWIPGLIWVFVGPIFQFVKLFLMRWLLSYLCNCVTMGCSPVRGDNPRALASALSYVQVDKHFFLFYITYISVDLTRHEIFCAKVG